MNSRTATPEREPETVTPSASHDAVPTPPSPAKKRAIAKVVVPIVVVIGLIFGIQKYIWLQAHESTDNAAVAADVAQVTPQITGTVTEILIQDNQEVKAGQLLFRLGDAKYQSAVEQAKGNLAAAIADAKAAGIDVAASQGNVTTIQLDARGTMAQADAGLDSARAGIVSAQAGLAGADANTKGAQSDLLSAKADLESARENAIRVNANIAAAKAQLSVAQAGVSNAASQLSSAVTQEALAKKTSVRLSALADQGAVSRQAADQANAAESTAISAVDSARQLVDSARSVVNLRTAELQSANTQTKSTSISIQQARLKIDSAQERSAAINQVANAAKAQVLSAKANLADASGKRTQSQGMEADVQTYQVRVTQKRAAEVQAQAKVDQARAALKSAQIDLDHTKIYAPASGRVSKRLVQIGAVAQPGSALAFLIPSDSIYVLANFKETQMANLKVGQPVEIEVDAFPGRSLKGRIQSTAPATGSTFALLPPDNSTGNFVKVVQRVPVKITFDEPTTAKQLPVGISALVSVAVK